jgi:hypothetical protein
MSYIVGSKVQKTIYDDIPDEKNDCTVRAYAAASQRTYLEAHAKLAAAGRKHGKGFRVKTFYEAEGFLWYPKPHRRVENFILNIAHTGNWIIWIRGHVFAVCDSVIHDTYPQTVLKRHVLGAWQVSLVLRTREPGNGE